MPDYSDTRAVRILRGEWEGHIGTLVYCGSALGNREIAKYADGKTKVRIRGRIVGVPEADWELADQRLF